MRGINQSWTRANRLLKSALGSVVRFIALPRARLQRHWLAHDPASTLSVNHQVWDRILAKYLSAGIEGGPNRFDYGAVSTADHQALKAYLRNLGETLPGALRRDEQLSFWINAYNALTIDLVLEHYPIQSITQIKAGFGPLGPWKQKRFQVDGRKLSLNDIEHRILRPIWKDPRLHYALNCASMGCPSLAGKAFRPEQAEAMLEAGARDFINGGGGILKVEDGAVTLSSVFSWYARDFGDSDGQVLDHLRKYAEGDTAARLEGVRKISGHGYDWRINRK